MDKMQKDLNKAERLAVEALNNLNKSIEILDNYSNFAEVKGIPDKLLNITLQLKEILK